MFSQTYEVHPNLLANYYKVQNFWQCVALNIESKIIKGHKKEEKRARIL